MVTVSKFIVKIVFAVYKNIRSPWSSPEISTYCIAIILFKKVIPWMLQTSLMKHICEKREGSILEHSKQWSLRGWPHSRLLFLIQQKDQRQSKSFLQRHLVLWLYKAGCFISTFTHELIFGFPDNLLQMTM